MPSVSALESEFLDYAIGQSHPFVRELAGESLSVNLLAAVRRDVDRIGNREFAERYARGWPFLNLPPARFNNRLIDLGAVRLIAGIRFRNLDPDFPFVGIDRSGVPIGSIGEPSALIARLAAEFAEFRPHALSFHHPSHLPMWAKPVRGDRHVMIAPARSMIEQAAPVGLDRVRLRPSTDLAAFHRYTALYDEIFAERPWLRGVLRVETRETLDHCRIQRLLFDVEIDGAWSGIVAGCADVAVGVSGIQVVEIVLSRQARGAGLGVAVQRRFAEAAMAKTPGAIVFGTIDDANGPMRRTAERAGRLDVGGTFLIDL